MATANSITSFASLILPLNHEVCLPEIYWEENHYKAFVEKRSLYFPLLKPIKARQKKKNHTNTTNRWLFIAKSFDKAPLAWAELQSFASNYRTSFLLFGLYDMSSAIYHERLESLISAIFILGRMDTINFLLANPSSSSQQLDSWPQPKALFSFTHSLSKTPYHIRSTMIYELTQAQWRSSAKGAALMKKWRYLEKREARRAGLQNECKSTCS